jgi:hypothetical protein
MGKTAQGLIFALVLIVTIVALDLSLFRHHTLARLLANVGVVLISLAIYLRFFKNN